MSGTTDLRIREYDPRDTEALVHLHEWAMREAGTDPADIPDTDDLRNIEGVYVDSGGTFLVGVDASAASVADDRSETFDGSLVAMGGMVPSEASHSDERAASDAAALHRMRVAPPVQGEGYGRQILDRLEAAASARGFERVFVTTATRQSRAVAFYRTAGYVAVGTSTEADYELRHFEKRLA
jgi:GNAT superfamily N-acetyltransferase